MKYDKSKWVEPDDWDLDEGERLKARFRIICKACVSENIAVNVQPMVDYGGQTGACGGYAQVGCNDCRLNDFFLG